jgi:hypothetical protein
MRTLIAMGLLLASIAAAHAFGFGLEGRGFGKLGASPKKGTAVAAATGKILMVDGASFILQTDAASKICRAGGC